MQFPPFPVLSVCQLCLCQLHFLRILRHCGIVPFGKDNIQLNILKSEANSYFSFLRCILEHRFGKYLLGLRIIWLVLYFFSRLISSCIYSFFALYKFIKYLMQQLVTIFSSPPPWKSPVELGPNQRPINSMHY